MTDTFTIPGALLRKLEDVGLEPTRLLREAGLTAEQASQPRPVVTTGQLFAFWQAIGENETHPAVGLLVGAEQRIERYDATAVAALCSYSFRDALERMSRYKRLTCPETIEVQRDGDACVVTFSWPAARTGVPPALLDLCFAWMLTIARRGTGEALAPKRVQLARRPRNREVHEAFYDCPVDFDAPRDALIFYESDLDRPFVTHNLDLLMMLAPQLDAELARMTDERPIGAQVKSALKRVLAGQRPSMRDVARQLGLSTRTLQRRLADDGVSFQQLLLEARREMARHYLLQPALELNEAAYLLGYGDPNSFFRAFQQWEGTSPGQWRMVHRETPEMEKA